MQNFGVALSYIRRMRGISQAQLAKRVQHSREYIGLLESNQCPPKLHEVTLHFVPALGLNDEPALARLLMLAARNACRDDGDSPSTPAPAHTDPARPNALPNPKYALLGRDTELNNIVNQLLHANQPQLITLVGAPGVGKTRLAIEIAKRYQTQGHAFFIELIHIAATADPMSAALNSALAHACQLPAPPAREPNAQAYLQNALRERFGQNAAQKPALFVLDNFEHLLGQDQTARQWLSQWRAQLPHTHWLITSRQALQFADETQYPLLPLPFDHMDDPALKLFAERARAVASYFRLTTNNWLEVANICKKIEGLPLAIELVAGQMQQKTLEALLSTVNSPAQLSHLPNHTPNRCARHRTLNNAIQWSYDLLSADEQRLLCRMALCVGGAEESCAITLNAPHTAGYTRVILQALVDKHLCRRAPAPGKTRAKATATRYVLFEAVREFAHAQLQHNADELARAQQQLFEHVYELAQCAQQALHTAREATWLNKLEHNDGTVREALTWALAHDLDRAMRLCVCLGDFWLMRGRHVEGQRWLRPILAHFEYHAAENPQHHVQALSLMGYLAQQQAHLPEAGAWQRKALALASQINNLHVMCDAHNCLAWNAYQLGDYAQAQAHFAGFLAAARGAGSAESIAQALCSLVQVKLDLGDNTVSDMLAEAKALFLQSGDQRGLAYWARLHSRWLLRQGSPRHAINWLNYALELDLSVGYQFYRGLTCLDLARVHWSLGELSQAESFAEQALGIFGKANLPFGLASIWRMLGLITIAHGKLAEAEQQLLQSIQLAHQSDYKQCLAEAHLMLAYVKSMQQHTSEAQNLFAIAEQIFASLPPYLDPPEMAFYQQVRAQLGVMHSAHTP